MTSFKSDCIAFLIDADNVSADVIQQAFELVQMRHRLVHIRRAHCTAEAALKHLELFKYLSIRPIVNMTTGKNCTDIALAVDAMEMAIIEKPDVVYIVSSDSDFAPLVIRLREKGCRVEGIGQKGKTGGASVGVYDDFVDIEHRKSPSHASHGSHASQTHAPSGRSAPAKRTRRGGGGRNEPAMPNSAPRRESSRDQPMSSRGEPRGDSRRDLPPPSRPSPMPRPEPMDEPPVQAEAPPLVDPPSLPATPAPSPAPAPAPAPDVDAPAPPQDRLPMSTEPAPEPVVEDRPPAAAKRGSRARAPAAGPASAAAKPAGRAPAKSPATKRSRTAAKGAATRDAPVEAEAAPATATPAPRPAPPPRPREPAPEPAPVPAPVPVPVAPPAFVMPELVPIPGLPDEVAHILAVVPRLRDGETVELSVAGERLRAAGLLAKSASSTRLFGKYRDHFSLTPNGQPNKVRFRPPVSDE